MDSVRKPEYGRRAELQRATNWTQREFNRTDALSGHPIASWLLGTPSSGSSQYNAFPINMYKYFAPWIQDDWRVSRRLTLNLGFRWDFNIPANERFNRMNRSFDRDAVNPVDAMVDKTQFPGLPTLRGGLLFAGVNGVPENAADTYMRALQPRAGFAYQLTSNLVMRGGWGRYYINPNNNFIQTNGFTVNTPLVNTLDNGRTPIPNVLNNPFPGRDPRTSRHIAGSDDIFGSWIQLRRPKVQAPLRQSVLVRVSVWSAGPIEG